MNSLAEACLVGLGVGGNYVRCVVIAVISMGIGGAKRYGGAFKVKILRGQATKRRSAFIKGIDPSLHHEGASHYVIQIF